MLDQKTFLQGINYLKAIYINWNFDINNDLALKVWYKKFSELENEVFMQLIEQYTDNNKWPPNSPSDILDLVKTFNTGGAAAWEYIVSLNKQYPLNNEFQKPKFYQELKKDSLAYDLFERLECEAMFVSEEEEKEKNAYTIGSVTFIGFGRGYRKDKFIKWYDNEMRPKNLLQIGASNQLLLS